MLMRATGHTDHPRAHDLNEPLPDEPLYTPPAPRSTTAHASAAPHPPDAHRYAGSILHQPGQAHAAYRPAVLASNLYQGDADRWLSFTRQSWNA